MTIERVWYESSPYLYLAAGLAATFDAAASVWMKGPATLLLAAAFSIIGMRLVNRRGMKRRTRERNERRREVALITQDLFFDAGHAPVAAGKVRR